MSKVSQKNFQKAAEQVLALLYEKHPRALAAGRIAIELGRDNEFIAKVMAFLHDKRLVALSRTAMSGRPYSGWKKWRLSADAYQKYTAIARAG